MPPEIFQESLNLEIAGVAPTSKSIDELRQSACWPLPELELSGRVVQVDQTTLVLENDLVRAAFAPDLGGRLIALFDRRTSRESFAPLAAMQPLAGGIRGVDLPFGVEVFVQDCPSTLAMGSVDWLVREPEEEGEPATLILADRVPGHALDWHLGATLNDSAAIQLQLTVHYRELATNDFRGFGFRVSWPGAEHRTLPFGRGVLAYSEAAKAGCALLVAPGVSAFAEVTDWCAVLHRGGSFLGPRQSDTMTALLVPISGLASVSGVCEELAFTISSEELAYQVHGPIPTGAMLLLRTESDLFEAPIESDPTRIHRIPIGSMAPATEVGIRRPGRSDEWLMPAEGWIEPGIGYRMEFEGESPDWPMWILDEPLATSDDLGMLEQKSRIVSERYGALAARSEIASRAAQFEEAVRHLETALVYQADDPMAWWQRARLARVLGEEDDVALSNAHALAPCEPLLRAEAFLRQSPMQGKEPNPLVRPLLRSPENFIEVACRLLELGALDDATRWLNEALRQIELPMLHYLQAYAFMVGSRMQVEAAEHVRLAGQLPIQPPFPWRRMEQHALAALQQRFDRDDMLEKWVRISSGI